MMLNATLLVQACNFFIAYLIIDRLLLRPTIRVIANEEQERSLLLKEINHEQEIVIQYQERKLHEWQTFQSSFASHIPHLAEIVSITEMPSMIISQEPELHEVKTAIRDLEQFLITRIGNVK